MDYKDTLLMLQTSFEMRGNLNKKEPGLLQTWQDLNMYQLNVEKNRGKTPYVFHDGPPYANGNLHMGHALNKILKDFVVRYKMMSGYAVEYIPGWDTHGLPIETAIQKQGINRKAYSLVDYRKYCEQYAHEQVSKQLNQMQRFGTLADYAHPYMTLQKEFEANELYVFSKMALRGLIYKGLKPVYWSYSSESALAEAEIEYHDKKSPAIYVAFQVLDGKGVLPTDARMVIWTTTPWTIPANQAIALNPKLNYVLIDSNKGKFVWLEAQLEALSKEFELENVVVLKTMLGEQMEYITTKHPLFERESLVVLGTHVEEEGTGCVHSASGHGIEDFEVCNRYNIPTVSVVDAKGHMMENTGPFAGLHIDDANKAVVMALDEAGALLKMNWITHSYPHDWRTKKPVIFRATDQWFASVEKIRDLLLSEIDQVKWFNDWGHIRIYNMIKDRGDWCISRQRAWGVPIPIIYCEDGSPIIDEAVFNHIQTLVKEHGTNIWFEKEAKELLPEGFKDSRSPNGLFTKETDTMDVWFDSGSSHTGVLVERGYGYPADLYLEGSDQYRGWFNSSLITGVAVYDKAPYKQVVSHGFVLDGKGKKMSKSGGNAVDPLKVIDQLGADILRLWTATVDYTQDVQISDELLKQVTETYRKIRNTIRFMVGNLFDFKATDALDYESLHSVDKFMVSKLTHLQHAAISAYDSFDFQSVVQTISNYMTNELSRFYLDYAKDILFVEKATSLRRRQVQTVLYHHVEVMTQLLTPVLPFTMEEVYQCCDFKEKEVFASLERFERLELKEGSDAILNLYDQLLDVRDDVLKALETKRTNKELTENAWGDVTICLAPTHQLVATLQDDLRQLFKVGRVTLTNTPQSDVYESSSVGVTVMVGTKCERCWNIYDEREMHDEHICERCHDVLEN